METSSFAYSLQNPPSVIWNISEIKRKIQERSRKVMRTLGGSYPCRIPFPKNHPWDLSGEHCIGQGSYYNTNMSVGQLSTVLAVCGHPIIDDILRWKKDEPDSIDKIIDAQVLDWLKILDIGCGLKPIFARYSRALGATVFTLDKESSESFKTNEECDQSKRDEEKEHHIELNIHNNSSPEVVYQRTRGNFDYITSAAIFEDWWMQTLSGMKIIQKNIKSGGLFYNHRSTEIIEIFP